MNWSASGRGGRLRLRPGASLGQCHSECARIPTRGIIVLSFFEPSFRTRPPTGRRSKLWAPVCLPTTDRAPRSWPLRGGFYEWAFWFLLVPSRPSTGFPVSVCFNFSEVAIRAFSSGVAFAQKQKSISVLFFAITQAGFVIYSTELFFSPQFNPLRQICALGFWLGRNFRSNFLRTYKAREWRTTFQRTIFISTTHADGLWGTCCIRMWTSGLTNDDDDANSSRFFFCFWSCMFVSDSIDCIFNQQRWYFWILNKFVASSVRSHLIELFGCSFRKPLLQKLTHEILRRTD